MVERSSDVIRKQGVILFTQRRILSELPGSQTEEAQRGQIENVTRVEDIKEGEIERETEGL